MRDSVYEGERHGGPLSSLNSIASSKSNTLEQLDPKQLNKSDSLPPVPCPSIRPQSHCFSNWPLCNLGYCYNSCPTDFSGVDHEPVEKIVIKMSDMEKDINSKHESHNGLEVVEEEDEEVPLEEQLTSYIYDNLMGRESTFKGPFGRKQVVYADLVSTGRSLKFLENFMMNEVLPALSDSEAMTTVTGLQSMLYLDETRNIIRQATNCGGDDHLIFGGATSGSNINGGFSLESVEEHLYGLNLSIVVFADIRIDERRWPWPRLLSSSTDQNVTVIDIPQTEDGAVDISFLKEKLEIYSANGEFGGPGTQLIGCFAAASRLNGVLQNDLEVTALLHMHGALAFWDYSTAGPYCVINMNPAVPDDNEGLYQKDLIFFSGDNFVGGMQTCGIAIVKSALLRFSKHAILGGNVDTDNTLTVSLGEPIRAGLAIQLKQSLSGKYIMNKHKEIAKNVQEKLDDLTSLIILGRGNRKSPNQPKNSHLSTLSFVVRQSSSGLYLHHNFICAVLNDLFGIQARGTSALDSKQSRYLFGLDSQEARLKYAIKLSSGNASPKDGGVRQHIEVIKPGYVTVDLPWFAPEEEISFILYAIRMVAEDGWKLLPQYLFNLESGEWLHHSNPALSDRKSLQKVSYASGEFSFTHEGSDIKAPFNLYDTLLKAKEMIRNAKKVAGNLSVPDQGSAFTEEAQKVRWFLLPTEAQKQISGSTWSKLKKASSDKLTIRASSAEISPKPKKSVTIMDTDDESNTTDNYSPFGTLAGDPILPIPTLGDRRKRSRARWLTRQSTEESDACDKDEEMEENDTVNAATVAAEVNTDKAEEEIKEQCDNGMDVENNEDNSTILVESHVDNEEMAQHGELDTIPEAKEEEEEQQEDDKENIEGNEKQQEDAKENIEGNEKSKKKGFGFSSFLTKFGVVSAAVKPTNQAKPVEENAVIQEDASEVVDKDIDMSEDNGSTVPSVTGDDQDRTPNPIQQYVFGWDEDDANKNNNANEQNQFQDHPAVSVPVA